MAVKNPFGRTVEQSTPHATYRSLDGSWEWLVLKTYQRPDMEDQHSRWFLAVMSPFLFGSHELGDGYALDVRDQGILVPEESTTDWMEAYGYWDEPAKRELIDAPEGYSVSYGEFTF